MISNQHINGVASHSTCEGFIQAVFTKKYLQNKNQDRKALEPRNLHGCITAGVGSIVTTHSNVGLKSKMRPQINNRYFF
jgi:hypothetical protein